MAAIDQATVRQEIRAFIYETYFFGDESEKFEDTDSFMEHGIIDSTGVLELTTFLEEKYGVTVDDDEMLPANLDSVANLVAFIQRKKS
ncbi:MAG: acyl carrier protein [candidate division Zixibacteria bacterium]|jgi:acyl carrier protein|nr:acyl carrier protein [candidate division Zixibacteria bacterium]